MIQRCLMIPQRRHRTTPNDVQKLPQRHPTTPKVTQRRPKKSSNDVYTDRKKAY